MIRSPESMSSTARALHGRRPHVSLLPCRLEGGHRAPDPTAGCSPRRTHPPSARVGGRPVDGTVSGDDRANWTPAAGPSTEVWHTGLRECPRGTGCRLTDDLAHPGQVIAGGLCRLRRQVNSLEYLAVAAEDGHRHPVPISPDHGHSSVVRRRYDPLATDRHSRYLDRGSDQRIVHPAGTRSRPLGPAHVGAPTAVGFGVPTEFIGRGYRRQYVQGVHTPSTPAEYPPSLRSAAHRVLLPLCASMGSSQEDRHGDVLVDVDCYG